jgi:L-malate glycosyltransferase
MKSLLLAPTAPPRLTGNAVTVERISSLLAKAGVICRIVDLSATPAGALAEIARNFQPDLIHAFHAYKAGPCGFALARDLAVPLLITMTGTDIYGDLESADTREEVLQVLGASARITVFNTQARSVLFHCGIDRRTVSVVHQSVSLPANAETDWRERLGIDREAPVFLLLGGIRRIKDFSFALTALAESRKRFPTLRLLIAGPVIEPEEFAKIQTWCTGRSWVALLGEVPRREIRALFATGDVLINTSRSESESNAVLEAMSRGKIVIARDIPGNASLFGGDRRFLFRDARELQDVIDHVLTDRRGWDRYGAQARRRITRSFSPAREQAGYLRAYRTCLKKDAL